MSSTKSENSNPFAEWTKARDIITFFDDKKHDLRKYGFSFVAGLLTAQALISSPLSGIGAVADYVKLAIILVSLILISMMRVTEKTYELLQRGANFRLVVLENKLDLGLSKSISAVYSHYKMSLFVTGVYIFFIAAAGLLGFAVLYTSILRYVAIGITIIGIIILGTMDFFFKSGAIHLGLDKPSYAKGDIITATMTNISEGTLKIAGSLDSAITIDGPTQLTKIHSCPDIKSLPPRSYYFVQFAANNANPGVYQLLFRDLFAGTRLIRFRAKLKRMVLPLFKIKKDVAPGPKYFKFFCIVENKDL